MPATSHIHLLDTVALVRDLPEVGLVAGEVGAVVEVLSDDAFEVEFVDESGHTYGLHTLRTNQLRRAAYQGTSTQNVAQSRLTMRCSERLRVSR